MSVSIDDVCRDLNLGASDCEVLKKLLPDLCPPCNCGSEEPKKARKRSRWQQCIAVRRKGQKFNPDAIRQLAKEYKEGKCP